MNTQPIIMRHTRSHRMIGGSRNWRTHRPYRPTYGLQPMDREDKSAPWLIGLAAVVAIYFAGRYLL